MLISWECISLREWLIVCDFRQISICETSDVVLPIQIFTVYFEVKIDYRNQKQHSTLPLHPH